MAHIRIEMKPAGKTGWELLGNFSASDTELAVIRAALAKHESPYDALKELAPGTLIYDTLDICRSAGHAVRVLFED